MILVFHVVLALASVIYTTALFFRPSEEKFNPAYLLAGGTLISGTVLVATRGTHLMESCITGIIYVCSVFVAITLAKRKLAFAKEK